VSRWERLWFGGEGEGGKGGEPAESLFRPKGTTNRRQRARTRLVARSLPERKKTLGPRRGAKTGLDLPKKRDSDRSVKKPEGEKAWKRFS